MVAEDLLLRLLPLLPGRGGREGKGDVEMGAEGRPRTALGPHPCPSLSAWLVDMAPQRSQAQGPQEGKRVPTCAEGQGGGAVDE